MAYNRKNLLRKIAQIQAITAHHRREGMTQNEIYYNFIKPAYFISLRTYNRYLSVFENFPEKKAAFRTIELF